ncbi:glycosyltransferase [Gordonia sp. Z-3]|uniref:glycosyltransferase n=1 Tax=Gordonia sp. Z-3 TaxID=3115408 RepID=UPI003FA525C7
MARPYLPAQEFDRLAKTADVVVSHSGVGSVLRLLDLGVSPVLVPRRTGRGEHVDDHQEQISRVVSSAGLGVSAEVEDLEFENLEESAEVRVEPAGGMHTRIRRQVGE